MVLVKQVLVTMIDVYMISLFIYIVMNFFPQTRGTRFYQFLEGLCEPLLSKFRFAAVGGISFAPLVVYLMLNLLQRLIIML